MNHFAVLLIAGIFVPSAATTDEPKNAAAVAKVAPQATAGVKPADAAAADKKKPDAKAEAAPAEKAKAVVGIFKAVGAAIQDKLAPAAPAEPVADQVVQQFAQQWLPQFKPLVTTELNFIRTVCQPSAEQYRTIKSAGDASLQRAVKEYADVQRKMQQGGFRAGQQPQWPDPRKIIADGLAETVQQTLTAEQTQRYNAELEKRAAARKHVAVINLVAKLDKDLVLTAEQRNKLAERLDANWKDSWVSQLEIFLYGDQFIPALPDDQVLPILNDKQKEIWKGAAKNQNTIWGWAGFGFVQPVEIDADMPANGEQANEQPDGEEPKDEKP